MPKHSPPRNFTPVRLYNNTKTAPPTNPKNNSFECCQISINLNNSFTIGLNIKKLPPCTPSHWGLSRGLRIFLKFFFLEARHTRPHKQAISTLKSNSLAEGVQEFERFEEEIWTWQTKNKASQTHATYPFHNIIWTFQHNMISMDIPYRIVKCFGTKNLNDLGFYHLANFLIFRVSCHLLMFWNQKNY